MSAFELNDVDWIQAAWTIAIAAVSSASCALLGCYLVLRRMSLLGDAISHAILPGIAIAFWWGGTTAALPMFIGAVGVGLLTAVLTETVHRAGNVPEDAGMGVVYTSLFALGVVMIARLASGRVDLDPDCVLYGRIEHVVLECVDIAGYSIPEAIGPLLATFVAVLLFVVLCWKELKLASFDPALATAMGLSAALVHYLLMAMVAVVSVAAFNVAGSVLVVAMLIVPAATAHLLTDRLRTMLMLAVGIAVLASVLGYLGAVYLNTVVAGMMAVALGLQFALAVCFAPRQGLLSRAWHRLKLSQRIVSDDIIAILFRAEEVPPETTAERPIPAADIRAQANLTPATTPGVSWEMCARAVGGGWIASRALRRLRRHGDVERAADGTVRLTARGRQAAQSLVRSHRLWEAYLGEHFDLPLDHLHEPAERVEHYIGPKLQERLASELARSDLDPHGKEIPPV